MSSPPSSSKISAISCAEYREEPLKRRCSMKWETPARASGSSLDPAPTQNPSATERTPGTRSEMTRSPVESSLSSCFGHAADRSRCTQKALRREHLSLVRGIVTPPIWADLCTRHTFELSERRRKGAPQFANHHHCRLRAALVFAATPASRARAETATGTATWIPLARASSTATWSRGAGLPIWELMNFMVTDAQRDVRAG